MIDSFYRNIRRHAGLRPILVSRFLFEPVLCCNGQITVCVPDQLRDQGDISAHTETSTKDKGELPKEDEKKLIMSDKSNEVTRLDRATLKHKDVLLSKLDGCKIFLEGSSSTLQLKDLRNCLVISGPVETSVFVTACSHCTFSVACQQLRIHESHHLTVYQQSSGCIIEDTTNCGFGPYHVTYPGIKEDFQEANLSPEEKDRWRKVEDFNYIVANKPSPNWKIIPENEREQFDTASL